MKMAQKAIYYCFGTILGGVIPDFMKQKSQYFFLLGGYDLEMAEIRIMLETASLNEGEDFLDYHLAWGAKLSAYAGCFHLERINVGIELQEDILRPERYLRIDHHNDLPSRPAAIEQVASLLGITLTRRQKLVAANDAGYIPAMQAMDASIEEIQQIRREDRACQGVTEQDELLAEKALEGTPLIQDGVRIVRALSSKFSPITDHLFGQFEKILIFTERELAYYGKNKYRLENRYPDWLTKGIAYSGGGEDGFWGISANALTEEEIRKLIHKIPQIV